MKLLYSLTSPYARKVRVVATEKRIEMDMQQVVLTDPDCPVNDHNPLGKIPVLLLDDGSSLFDSRVIVEYLDSRTPLARLIPQEHGTKIWVRRWEALADGICDAAIAAVQESRRPESSRDSSVEAKQLAKVARGLRLLSADLGDNRWCVDETFSLADVALGCMLGWLELRLPTIEWKQEYPNLANHYSELLKRPSFSQTQLPLI